MCTGAPGEDIKVPDQVDCLCKEACNTDGADQEYIDINEECSGNNKCCKPCSSTCGGNFTGPMGSFTSPNYPSNYCNNQDCFYNITVEDGERVILNFTNRRFDAFIWSSDFVKVYNGEIANPVKIFAFVAGPFSSPRIVEISDNPSSNTVIVYFSSGETQTNPGFQVTYKIIW
ncbi:CUBN [Mytilus coruscus]|uniref:CUBN n=1 Tax=Mytilus coruscus TaxID=42192 RepID=A0A6J8F0E4_MYTCO|nr:CUBN [Mytilus coruscus]